MVETEVEILTPAEAAERLRCSVQTIHNMIRDKQISAIRIRRHWKIKSEEVERLLAGKEKVAA